MWAMSDYQRMPTHEEAMQFDERWFSDLALAYRIYAHQHNQSPEMQALENASASDQILDAATNNMD